MIRYDAAAGHVVLVECHHSVLLSMVRAYYSNCCSGAVNKHCFTSRYLVLILLWIIGWYSTQPVNKCAKMCYRWIHPCVSCDRPCWVTSDSLPPQRQSTFRRGQQHELRSAELVKERRPKSRCVLIKSGLKWCWGGVREIARARSIDHDAIPYKCVTMTHRYEYKIKVDKKSNSGKLLTIYRGSAAYLRYLI